MARSSFRAPLPPGAFAIGISDGKAATQEQRQRGHLANMRSVDLGQWRTAPIGLDGGEPPARTKLRIGDAARQGASVR